MPITVRIAVDSLQFFDFSTGNWGRTLLLSASLDYGNYGTYATIHKNVLFYCGGRIGSKSTYLLQLSDNSVKVQQLPSTGQSRAGPGLFVHYPDIVLFGGLSSAHAAMASCETLSLSSTHSWTPLPQQMLTPRWGFSPCEYNRKVYLYGRGNAGKMDAYSLENGRFERVVVGMRDLGASVMWPFRGKLIVFLDSRVDRVFINDEFPKIQSKPHRDFDVYPNSLPILLGKWVCWVNDSVCTLVNSTPPLPLSAIPPAVHNYLLLKHTT